MKHDRRKNALARLEAQIKSGVKTCKGSLGLEKKKIPLSEQDKKRIQKEIEILKNKK